LTSHDQWLTAHLSWDDAYTRELRNHEEDADDEGTVWFSESNAEEAILAQLDALEEKGLLGRGGDHGNAASAVNGDVVRDVGRSEPARFLDLGTGNGHLLFALRDEDEEGKRWHGDMIGVDYSETSVQLAQHIALQKGMETCRFARWDLLVDSPGDWLGEGFDVVLDKGTFDAISLMPFAADSPHPCDVYREKVVPLVKPGRFFFITSCNWTKDELIDWLAPGCGELSYYGEAKYPTFTFGGHTGQTIVTLVLRRKATPQTAG